MVCVVCHTPQRGIVCHECIGTVRPGGERLLPGGLRVVAAFEHTGAAVPLVHHLKYRGLLEFAQLVAEVLRDKVEPAPLVPVPRAWSRRYKHGVDPAYEIARRLGALWNEPILAALARPIHTRRRAGGNHDAPVNPFRLKNEIRSSVYVVDDVVTTGATVSRAVDAVGAMKVNSVLTANVAHRLSSLFFT